MVVSLDRTRSVLRSISYGNALDGLNSIDHGGGIRREDSSEFTDTIDVLEEHGYLDDISKDRQEIMRARRSYNKILLFSDDEEYEAIHELDRLRRQVLTQMEERVDRVSKIIERGSILVFLFGVIFQGLYFSQPPIASMFTPFLC